MKPTLYLITIAFLFSSCATIWNRKRQRIVFHTHNPTTVIYQPDTIPITGSKVILHVKRQNQVVKLRVTDNNVSKQITLYPHISTAFWLNLPANLGLGMLVDMLTSKSWGYPSRIDLDNYDSISYHKRYRSYSNSQNSLKSHFTVDPPQKKGELYFHISLPFINHYDFLPEGETRNKQTGIWGGSVGLDYEHSKNQFLSLNFSRTDDLLTNFAMDHFSSYSIETERSESISLSNNHRISRLTIGYGIAVARNSWNLKRYQVNRDSLPPPTRTYANKTHYAFGFVVPMYYQFSKSFYTGLVYRPTFYRPNLPDKFKYEHTMSLNFAWKFRIKK
jgi:hypothetical protein